ncbi:MAG: carboxypeptidase-like regulatory domain-containing protein [Acidobacteriota bacterium]|nr:carboxypeptidase-like regulatory domain-containing protein [Acidobacteriota bacterium]
MTTFRRISLLCLFLPCLALAQDRGTISGVVTDSSGGMVPDAKIVLKNPSTNLSRDVVSGAAGTYTIVNLPAGDYQLTVSKEGFRGSETPQVHVDVNTTTHVDVTLQLGSTKDVIEVQANVSLLQTDRSDLGQVISNRAINDLPLFANGGLRSNVAFTALAPGVNSNIASDPDSTGANIRIAGGLANGASQLLDGSESQSERKNDPQMRVVSAEGIEEFKVQTSAYSAEFGRASNGILNYTTKSGTNEFHGTVFGVIRNQALNASGFFYTAPTVAHPVIHNQNLEAASFGGPIRIPKLIDLRDKAFFFLSGERSRAKDVSNSGLISLAPAAFRNGDFRGLTDSRGAVIPLYDPFDASGNLISDASQRQRLSCAGVLNVICPSRINPVASLIESYVPLPSNPNGFLNNNAIVNNGSRTPGENQGVYAVKGDYNATQNMHFSGVFSRQYFNGYTLVGPIPGPVSEAFQEFGATKWVRLNGDQTLSSNLLNHFAFGYNQRDLGEQGNTNLGAIDGTYGKATAIPGVLSYGKSPNYSAYSLGTYGNRNTNISTRSPGKTISFSDTATWLKGKHSLKAGFEFVRATYSRQDCNGCAGSANFGSGATGNPTVSGTTGFDYASFLLGTASGGSFNYGANINYIFPYYAGFVQDDIKVSSRLTVNIGLRYDLPLPRREENFQNSNFDPTVPNPGAGNLPGALIFAGTGDGRTGRTTLLRARKNAWGPRLGFAYQVSAKTVIRGGGGILYDSNREDGNADNGIQGFGGSFNAVGDFLSSGVSFLLKDGYNTFGNLVTAGKPPIVSPTIQNFGSPTYVSDGQVGQFYDYNFTIEHSISPKTLIRGSYHANLGNQLQSSQNYNQLDPKYIGIYGSLLSSPLSSVLSNPIVINSGYRLPYAGYPTTRTLAQSLAPFPQYSLGFGGTTNGGHSTWHAFESSFQHNYSRGLYLLVSYTFSKFISNNTSINVYASNTEKSISSSDRPHVFSAATIYDLPFGKGKSFGANLHPAINAVLGNWRASAVQHYQSGNPIQVTAGQNLYGAGNARPSYVPGQPLLNPNFNSKDPTSRYLNPAAFIQPANGVFGDVPAYIPNLRQPIQLSEDVALSKDFPIGDRENKNFEFRASAFNIANRHLLGGLTNGITSAAYGQFTNPQTNQPRNIEFSLRFRY